VKPDLVELAKVMNFLEIDLEQLICLGILVGTDYNPKGIPGIGQKKALQIVKKFKQPILIFEGVGEQIEKLNPEDKFNWKEIFELFHKPNVALQPFNFPKIDEEKIKEILIEEHNFSEERVEKQLERLREINEKNKQKGLDKWF
jgi:flap endonuclease-1